MLESNYLSAFRARKIPSKEITFHAKTLHVQCIHCLSNSIIFLTLLSKSKVWIVTFLSWKFLVGIVLPYILIEMRTTKN